MAFPRGKNGFDRHPWFTQYPLSDLERQLILLMRSGLVDEVKRVSDEAQAALRERFGSAFRTLGLEAESLVLQSPPAALRHPWRADDRLLDLQRKFRLGVELARMFHADAASAEFWEVLDDDAAAVVQEKWREGARPMAEGVA